MSRIGSLSQDPTGNLTQLAGTYFLEPSVDNLTAHAGGGQGSALPLTQTLNRITTVGSANDSVLLPPSKAGMAITVTNAAAVNSMNVFPAAGESINALAANAAFAVAAGKTCQFVCYTAGLWHTLLSA